MSLPVTPRADRARCVPETPAARQDDITAALRSLREERRRLERLGLELPLARCHHETRYWNFLAGLFAAASPGPGDLPCPDAPVR